MREIISLSIFFLLLRSAVLQTILQKDYENGGASWTGLCANEDDQSPIDVLEHQSKCDEGHAFEMRVDSGQIGIEMKQNSIDLYFESNLVDFFLNDLDGDFIGFNSEIIRLKTPSENWINGIQMDAEMQILCKIKPTFFNAKHQFAVLSFMIKELSEEEQKFLYSTHKTYSDILKEIVPWKLGKKSIDFSAFIEKEVGLNPEYYYYEGSLTEPPCTEEVSWIILKKIFYITTLEKTQLHNIFVNNATFASGHGNNRALKSKGERRVVKGGVGCSVEFLYVIAFGFLYMLMMYFIFKLL